MQTVLKLNLKNILLALSEVTDVASPLIARHQQRTAIIAMEIAKYSNVSQRIANLVFGAALLHDVGAISVEEKISLHTFETKNHQIHSNRSAVLLEKVPWLKETAQAVRKHHTVWPELEGDLDDPVVFAAQVVYLADLVERLIDRERPILLQIEDIVARVRKLQDIAIHPQIVATFVELAKREAFWLNLVSHYYMMALFAQSSSNYDAQFQAQDLLLITEVFRNIIDFKSPFTATHSSGVSGCALKLAELYGFTTLDLNLMEMAGDMHDIGKMAIPNQILDKAGRLTEQEFAIVKSHPYYTYYILKQIAGHAKVVEWAAFHHEKLDGSGYPFHRTADKIDVGARMMAVADIFTAIAEDRPYRPGMTKPEIYKILRQQVMGGLIEGRIVDLLFDNYDLVSGYVRQKQKVTREFYENQFLYGT